MTKEVEGETHLPAERAASHSVWSGHIQPDSRTSPSWLGTGVPRPSEVPEKVKLQYISVLIHVYKHNYAYYKMW